MCSDTVFFKIFWKCQKIELFFQQSISFCSYLFKKILIFIVLLALFQKHKKMFALFFLPFWDFVAHGQHESCGPVKKIVQLIIFSTIFLLEFNEFDVKKRNLSRISILHAF